MKKEYCKVSVIAIGVVIFSLFMSCNQKTTSKESDSFYTIPFAEILESKRDINLSEFATDVTITQFENIPEAFLGRIEKVQLSKDFIFINTGNSSIIQFTREGQYVRHVGGKGRGPGEYDLCRTFSIDETNKQIYIQTNMMGKIVVYDFNGKFVEDIKYPAVERLKNVWSRDSMFVSFAEPMEGNEPYLFIEHNKQGDTLQTIPNYIKWDNSHHYYNMYLFFLEIFYRFDNTLHMKGWYNDTVYYYNQDNKITPKFFVDLEDYKIPDDLIYERKWTRSLPKDLCWIRIHESSNYVFIPYGYHFDMAKMKILKEEEGCVLYNKNSKQGLATNEAKSWGFTNDITGGPDFKPTYINENEAVAIVSAIEMKEYLDSDRFRTQEVKLQNKKEKLYEIQKNIKDEENSFIVLVKLKEQ